MYIDKAKLLEWIKKEIDSLPKGMMTDTTKSQSYSARKRLNKLREEIESGAFDADEPDFKCPHCEKINSASLWNAATREVFGEDIGEIQDAAGDMFICPACKSESDLRDISKV